MQIKVINTPLLITLAAVTLRFTQRKGFICCGILLPDYD